MKTKIKTKKTLTAKNSGNYKLWVGLGCLLLFTWAVFFYIYRGVIVPASQTPVTKAAIQVNEGDAYYFTAKDKGSLQINQGFFCSTSELMGIGVSIQTKEHVLAPQEIHAHVIFLDGVTKEYIFDKDLEVKSIRGRGEIQIIFDEPLQETKDKYYEVSVRLTGESADNLYILGTTNENYTNLAAAYNDQPSDAALGIDQYIKNGSFLAGVYKIFVLLFSCFLIAVFWLIFFRKAGIEKIYLFTVMALGLFYCFVIVPFAVPDESMHASTVYRISNDIMGVPETKDPETIYKRMDDAAVELNNDCNLNQYYIVYSQLLDRAEQTELYETGYRDTGASGILYAPAVAGVLLGRLLNFGPVAMYMLARILTLVVFALLTYYAMKKLPFGKATLFIICILPMTLQQAASMSYDAMINAITTVFIALCFNLVFSERGLKRLETGLACALGGALILAKGGAYLPLILLFTMIPAFKFGGEKKKGLAIGIFITGMALIFMISSMGILFEPKDAATISDAAEQEYSLSYILTNPSVVFSVGMGTFLHYAGYYIATMIGQQLGFLNIILDDVVVYGFLLLLFLSVLSVAEDKYVLIVKHKATILCSALFSILLVLMSMWLFITPRSSGIILGVQGRYFIPLLWPVLMLFRNKVIVLRKNIDTGLIFGAVGLHVLAFAYIFRGIF